MTSAEQYEMKLAQLYCESMHCSLCEQEEPRKCPKYLEAQMMCDLMCDRTGDEPIDRSREH